MPNRRQWLLQAAQQGVSWSIAGLATRAVAAEVDPTHTPAVSAHALDTRIVAAWRGPMPGDAHEVGALRIQVQTQSPQVSIDWAVRTPSRAHGLVALPDGGCIVVATRPGIWLWRLDSTGRVTCEQVLAEGTQQTLNGHALLTADGQHLVTTQTGWGSDDRPLDGWLSVRRLSDLKEIDRFPSGGLDPHDLALAPDGLWLVANGGVMRDRQDRALARGELASNLAAIDPRTGRLQARHQLLDAMLSIRHLAWGSGASAATLGIALQAEHAEASRRRDAPSFATWQAASGLALSASAELQGYAGDVAAYDNGGWVASHARLGRAMRWPQRDIASPLTVATLREVGALASDPSSGGVWLAAAHGLGWWHPSRSGWMQPWPKPMVLDNHMRVLTNVFTNT